MVKTEIDQDAGIAPETLGQFPAQLLDQGVSVGIGVYGAMQFYAAFEARRQCAAQRTLDIVPFQSAGKQTFIRPGQMEMGQEVHRPTPYRVLY